MQKILPILFLFISTMVFAQHVEWSINIAPGISYRIPQKSNVSAHAVSVQAGEKPMHTFDFGVDMRARINDRLKIGTAILYSQKGFSNTHIGAIYDDFKVSRIYIIDYIQDYLEIPFFLTYAVYKKEKTELYPLIGMTNSLLLHDKNHLAIRSGELSEEIKAKFSDPYLENTAQHNLGILMGWGAMTQVDSKTSVGLEAQGKFMLTPLTDKVSFSNRYLYSIGLNFRFIRRLN